MPCCQQLPGIAPRKNWNCPVWGHFRKEGLKERLGEVSLKQLVRNRRKKIGQQFTRAQIRCRSHL